MKNWAVHTPTGHTARFAAVDILAALIVGESFGNAVIKVVGCQARCLGCDGGQSGNNLILHHVAGRPRGVVVKTVVNVLRAVIFAGVILRLTDSLFQAGDALRPVRQLETALMLPPLSSCTLLMMWEVSTPSTLGR